MPLQSCLDQSGEKGADVADVHPEMFGFDVLVHLRFRLKFFFAHQAVGVDALTGVIFNGHFDVMI